MRKCSRTFSTALTLMDEYPHYRFTVSQAQLYDYTKRYYPRLYERIKEKVESGQWEPNGSTWVEMDCNIPSGESLVRQFLYGKRLFQEEFGRETKVLWLPDVFGYSAALPQIMKKAGVDYFLTNKIQWNDTNRFPHNLFQWEGIDGSRVLAHIPPTGNYNGSMAPKQLHDLWAGFQPKHLVRDVIYSYGFGDGGGGVTREMLERAKRVRNMPGLPQCETSTAGGYFASVAPTMPDLPIWRGELYFELHRGTYTTQARNKRFNRKSEILYRQVEMWNSLAGMITGHPYPKEVAKKGWQAILLHQFHDIIPGSSIAEVYEDSTRDYERIMSAGEQAVQAAMQAIARRIDTGGVTSPVVVFNSRSWAATDIAELPIDGDAPHWVATDLDGHMLPAQIVESESGRRLIFLACDVPAMGYKVFSVAPASEGDTAGPAGLATVVTGPNGWPEAVDTPLLRLEFSSDGRLTSIYDKTAQREVLDHPGIGNEWQLFEDRPHRWDAWDIELQYRDKPLGTGRVTALSVIENGPVRAVIRCQKAVGGAEFQQDITLYGHTQRIDFATTGEWHEKHALLKVAFPVKIRAAYATFDIAYGAVERSTHENTSWDQAQFEVSAHKWADLSEGNYGVSLLNDCKYGYDVLHNVLRLSLLRAPTYPDPHADEGRHYFTYSLYPHCGNWREGQTVQAAYSLNQPFTALGIAPCGGRLPQEQSLVKSLAPNAVVEVVKAAEDAPDTLVVRVFDAFGQSARVQLRFPLSIAAASECDLLERDIACVSYEGETLSFDIRPYEIRTFKVRLA